MRSRIIVLLAVCSNVAVAGVLRRRGARPLHHNAARFLNNTETSAIPAEIQTSTTVTISSSSIILSFAASPDTSSLAATSSAESTAKPLTPNLVSSSSSLSQALLTSATLPTALPTAAGSTETANVQPAETVSKLFNLAAGNPSTSAQSSPSTSSPSLSASLSTTSDISSTTNIRNVAATLLSSSAASQVPSSEVSPTASAMSGTSDAASQASTSVVVPVPISSGLVQVLAASSDTFAPITLDPNSPSPTGTAKYPTAEKGNTAMAAGFNSVYKTLTVDSPCNPRDPNEAYACVDGEIAECQSDETYVLKSCFQGQSCYALPKASGSTGIVVQCAVPSDAYSVLAGLSSSTAAPVAVTSQPAQVSQAEGGLSQTTQSASTQSSIQPVTSSSSVPATVESQTTAPTATVFAMVTTLSHDQGPDQVNRATVSTTSSSSAAQEAVQSQSQALNSPLLAGTATAQQTNDLNLFTSSRTFVTSSSASSTTPAVLTSSSTSDTSSSVSSSTPAVESIPNALFAVVTGPESEPTSTSEMSKQGSVTTSQTSQTPIKISSAMSPPADPDKPPAAEGSSASTSTSSTDGATITFAPTGFPVNEKVAVGNGQATVTVTVTVTTTERPAPVTILAS